MASRSGLSRSTTLPPQVSALPAASSANSGTILQLTTDNQIYQSNGVSWNSLIHVENLAFSKAGALTVATGVSRIPIHGGTFNILSIAAMVNTAPTGASVILDIKKNGTTIFGTSANRPTIAAGATAATVGANSVTSVTTGDYLTVDVAQIGSTVAGSDLVLSVRLQRVA